MGVFEVICKMKKIGYRMAITALVSVVVAGCTSFETRRVSDDGTTSGFPFIFKKTYIAVVTYFDDSRTSHILSVPTLYAVDVKQSPLGTSDILVENSDSGFAKKATAKIDHKIPENIGALTALLKELGVKSAADPGIEMFTAATKSIFDPGLTPKPVKSISLTSINLSSPQVQYHS